MDSVHVASQSAESSCSQALGPADPQRRSGEHGLRACSERKCEKATRTVARSEPQMRMTWHAADSLAERSPAVPRSLPGPPGGAIDAAGAPGGLSSSPRGPRWEGGPFGEWAPLHPPPPRLRPWHHSCGSRSSGCCRRRARRAARAPAWTARPAPRSSRCGSTRRRGGPRPATTCSASRRARRPPGPASRRIAASSSGPAGTPRASPSPGRRPRARWRPSGSSCGSGPG